MTTENKKTLDAIVALAKSLTKEEDEAERKKLLDTLRDVAYSIESPEDTVQRIMFYVKKNSLLYQWWQQSVLTLPIHIESSAGQHPRGD